MNHFKGVNEDERHKNEMLQEQRKTNTLLEQIAQLLQQPKIDQRKAVKKNDYVSKSNSNGSGRNNAK